MDIGALLNGNWLWDRLNDLAAIGALSNGGVCREALSDGERSALVLLAEWAGQLGCTIHTDAIGNLFIRREGIEALPPVLIGSHIDTQPVGGKYDGTYGVLAGLALLEAFHRAGVEHRRPIEVVAWTNEEGSRFSPAAMGSACFTGHADHETLRELRDVDGTRLGDELDRTLLKLERLGATRREFGFPVHCYLEAHIEQGPILEAEGAVVGIVNAIQGANWYQFEVRGSVAHAGTTPRALRKDAFAGAMELAAALREQATDPDDEVRFTIGRFILQPGSPNTIPDSATFTVDLRHYDNTLLERLDLAFSKLAERKWANCSVEMRREMCLGTVRFDDGLLNVLERTAKRQGIEYRRLSSGAFHDAAHLARHCPSAMLFIPCEGGISHHPHERITKEDAIAGARVLAEAVISIA
ncbi:M20 family metallo-hydrolase [Billgrantia endophytica]|uniref:Zn-dependent hydrolase n=1 Tax=Billgrantia endophytica TaxID=2033802 RepID=A0A2N7U9W4_9GAMM|nr:M20 family metallo-hydrolase [Halomonas endophytica]PMR77213.1 Zn-dependent hydrolase [Halomonas endophytica]